MVQKLFQWIKNQSKIEFSMRLVGSLLLLLLVGANLYNTAFWRNHSSLGFDIDYDNGRIMQIFLGSENHLLLSLDDRILSVNGMPAADFKPLYDLQPGQIYNLEVLSSDGELRMVPLPASKPDNMALWEHNVFPFMGLVIYIFGLVILMALPVDRVTISFTIYMFFSAILFVLNTLERYLLGGTGFISLLVMMLVVESSIEFHWHFLNIRLARGILIAARAIIAVLCLAYVIVYFINPSMSMLMDKTFFYVFWIFSFLFILFLFTVQYVYDELSRGMLRILLLTFFASLGPLIYFVLIPLILNDPRTMPAIISVVPILMLPLNYALMIQRKKQYVRITCTILSFVLTMLVVYFLVQVASSLMDQWFPEFSFLQRGWLSQLLMALMIGISIILYHFIFLFVQRFVYGDVSGEARQMKALSNDPSTTEDTNTILIQTAEVFQKFFDFSFLRISLQDGTLLQFDGQGQSETSSVDRFAVLSVLNRFTFRGLQQDKTGKSTVFIDMDAIHDLVLEYHQIFGGYPEYVFLLGGRGYPVGVISAGPRKNGERFDAMETQQLEALLSQYQAIVENLFLMDEVEKRSQQVRKIGQQLLEAREDERKRIARDMHDNIIQALTAFRYTMNELYDKDKLAISDEEADNLQRSLQVISQDIRDICFNLRPPALDATGFRSAVVSIIETHHRNNHLSINLDISDSPVIDLLSDMVSICLYRVLQEALINIGKHAKTDAVWVTMDATDDFVQLKVEDNGVGFVVPDRLSELVTEGHFGLTGIQEFLEIVNGALTIHSVADEGSQLIARIPLVKTGGQDDLYYDYRR